MAPKAKHGASDFARVALPKQFCNLDRLLFALERRGLDGIVATLPYNVFYLSGFNGVAHKADEPRPYALVLSRHAPQQPVLVVADYYLATPPPPSPICHQTRPTSIASSLRPRPTPSGWVARGATTPSTWELPCEAP